MISDNFLKFTAWGVRKVGAGTLISLLLLLLVLGSTAAGLKSITAIQAETSLILVANSANFSLPMYASLIRNRSRTELR